MVATSAYMIVFRVLHILAGVIWVGALFLMVTFLQPTAKSLGPAAGPFLQELMARRRLPVFMLATGAVTIAAGLFLYWRDWQAAGSLGDWIGTRYGAILTVGSVAALLGWLIGLFGLKPLQQRMLQLAAQVAAAGGPPPPDRAAELQSLQVRTRRLALIILTLLVVAVLAMATARYW